MSFFTNSWAYAADSVLDQIHNILVESKDVEPGYSPSANLVNLLSNVRKLDGYHFREHLRNIGLILNITSGGVSEIPKKRGWSLENDHIFPRAELERRKIELDVNDIGNFRLLPELAKH